MNESAVLVTVHSQPGCHLCDEALGSLEAIRPEYPGMRIVVADINRSDETLKLYLERIPVVEINGAVVSELVLDIESVRYRLDNP